MFKILLISIFITTPVFATSKCSLSQLREKLIKLTNIKYPTLKTDKEIKIAVIDTGINIFDDEIRKQIYVPDKYAKENAFGYNAINDSSFPYDEVQAHGSHVTGIILALLPSAKIFPIKFYKKEKNDENSMSRYLKGLRVAVESDVDIINLSMGGALENKEELELLTIAKNKGIIIIAAAGNEKKDIDTEEGAYYPASYDLDNIISVGNMMSNNQIHPSSNWGKKVHLMASGTSIPSYGYQDSGCDYKLTGTSQATPFVTALVGMMKSQNKDLTPLEIKNKIINSTLSSDSKIKKIVNFNIFDKK